MQSQKTAIRDWIRRFGARRMNLGVDILFRAKSNSENLSEFFMILYLILGCGMWQFEF
jgi:hypothetical protein